MKGTYWYKSRACGVYSIYLPCPGWLAMFMFMFIVDKLVLEMDWGTCIAQANLGDIDGRQQLLLFTAWLPESTLRIRF